jgi:hypothetical protein
LKCDGTRAETRFGLSAKQMSPFKWAGASVRSTAGSRGVRISGSNAANTVFRGSMKSTGYTLHSPDSPSLPLPCVTVYHHILTGLYKKFLNYEFLLLTFQFEVSHSCREAAPEEVSQLFLSVVLLKARFFCTQTNTTLKALHKYFLC